MVRIFGREAGGKADGLDPGGVGGADAARRILHHDALGRGKAQAGRARLIDLGVGLRVFDVRAGHQMIKERLLRADGAEVHQHLHAVGRRADRQLVAAAAQGVQNVQHTVRDVGLFFDVLAVARVEIVLHLRAVRHAVFFCHAADIAVLAAADKLGEVGFLRVNAVFLQRTDAGFRHVFLRIDQHAVHIE